MKHLQSITWQEILEKWQESEESFWKDFYTNKGFDKWKDWRMSYFKNENLQKNKWGIYKISAEEILNFSVSPLYGWKKAAIEVKSKKFKDIIHAPVLNNYKKLEDIKKDFPKEVFLIGLEQDEGIRIIDGHHRASVISKMFYTDNKIEVNIYLYLGR